MKPFSGILLSLLLLAGCMRNTVPANDQSSAMISSTVSASRSNPISSAPETREAEPMDSTTATTATVGAQSDPISPVPETREEEPVDSTTATTVTVGAQSDPISPVPETREEEPMNSRTAITVTVDGQSFSATLEDSETVRTLVQLLPLTLDMSELNGNEKYFYLDQSLPTDAKNPGQIRVGNLMLYGDNCLVLFYESFSTSYSYTRLGSIDDPAGLTQAVGRGSATVTFAIQD